MGYYMSSGNATVDSLADLNISGNVIPQIWYRTIVRSNGKPNLLAITILADIVYWYRPTEIRDERSGQVIGWRKKFHGDLLQKSYASYAELFGESKRSVKAAMDTLEELGIIQREFRDIFADDGRIINNIMYIGLKINALRAVTYPQQAELKEPNPAEKQTFASENDCEIEENQKRETNIPLPQNDVGGGTKFCGRGYKLMQEGVQNDVGGDTKLCRSLVQQNVPPGTTFCGTNTKITTENTYTDISINQSYIPVQQDRQMEEESVVEEYRMQIRKNIMYDYYMVYGEESEKELIVDLYEIICDIVCYRRKSVRIGGADYPYEVVKKKFLKLTNEHIEYVVESMRKTTTQITNIKSYLLTALFAAPDTLKYQVKQQVQHDWYGVGS